MNRTVTNKQRIKSELEDIQKIVAEPHLRMDCVAKESMKEALDTERDLHEGRQRLLTTKLATLFERLKSELELDEVAS